MLRDNYGQPIFFSEEDKSRLCLLIQQGVERFSHNIEPKIRLGIGVETEFDFKSGCIAGMVGNQAFVEEIMVTSSTIKHKKIELTDLIMIVCEIHNITQEQLYTPGKHTKNSRASALLAYFVGKIEHISYASLAKFLGEIQVL